MKAQVIGVAHSGFPYAPTVHQGCATRATHMHHPRFRRSRPVFGKVAHLTCANTTVSAGQTGCATPCPYGVGVSLTAHHPGDGVTCSRNRTEQLRTEEPTMKITVPTEPGHQSQGDIP